MKPFMTRFVVVGAGVLLGTSLQAAEPESTDPQPAVNTSAPQEPVTGRGNPRRPEVSVGPAPSTAAPAQPESPAQQPAAQEQGSPRRSNSADRIELGTTQITGNAELPRVMYVVPWKKAELGDLAGKPAKSLLDEVLAPVDRDVFRRQNRYYEALKPDEVPRDP
jgi:hypothetical protein